MGIKTFTGRLQSLRGTQAEWEASNPVLLNGERILVTMPDGEIKEKIGDGIKTYNQIDFYKDSNNFFESVIPNAYNSTTEFSSDGTVITIWNENGKTFKTVLTDQSTDITDIWLEQMYINNILVASWSTTNETGKYVTTYIQIASDSDSSVNDIPNAYDSITEFSADGKVVTTTWTENGKSYKTVFTDNSTDAVDIFENKMYIDDVLIATWNTTNESGKYITNYTVH